MHELVSSRRGMPHSATGHKTLFFALMLLLDNFQLAYLEKEATVKSLLMHQLLILVDAFYLPLYAI